MAPLWVPFRLVLPRLFVQRRIEPTERTKIKP